MRNRSEKMKGLVRCDQWSVFCVTSVVTKNDGIHTERNKVKICQRNIENENILSIQISRREIWTWWLCNWWIIYRQMGARRARTVWQCDAMGPWGHCYFILCSHSDSLLVSDTPDLTQWVAKWISLLFFDDEANFFENCEATIFPCLVSVSGLTQ